MNMRKNLVNSVDAKAYSKANTEPSRIRDGAEGVENTKAIQNGRRVGIIGVTR
jgi:hypothetical protein